MASVRFIGGSVSHIARSRSLGEHIGPQHRLRSAHRSVRTSHRHYKPTGSYRLMYVFVYTVHAVLATMTLDLICMRMFLFSTVEEIKEKALKRYNNVRVSLHCVYTVYIHYTSGSTTKNGFLTTNMFVFLKGEGHERLVSGSDDFTMFLWNPAEDKKPVARMTGHQALVNEVLFSPDTRLIASASFDKSIKIWDGKTGK